MSDEAPTYRAWSMQLSNCHKVTCVHETARERTLFEFKRDGHKTTIVLSDPALYAVVHMAVHRVGVPVMVPDQTPRTDGDA